jgi:glycosyltransferase involved in cell wall biosynthesis
VQHNKIIFIQKRPNRGGAQVALSRILMAREMREMTPLVIIGSPGWLTQECQRQRINFLITDVPSVRSLSAQLWGTRSFIRMTSRVLSAAPSAVIANNHQEAILAAKLGRALGTRSAVILRDSYLTADALKKYGWDEADHTIAVGTYLTHLATETNANVPVAHLYDCVTDFSEPKQKPSEFPKAVLVVGSSAERKGWRTWINAVEKAIHIEPGLAGVCFDFTGTAPDGFKPSERFKFNCQQDDFFALVRRYDLVVNPSQSESFGLAGAEALAAGVPLLTTPVGVLGSEIWVAPQTLMGKTTEHMTESLCSLYRDWAGFNPMVEKSQDSIRKFAPARSAETILKCIK